MKNYTYHVIEIVIIDGLPYYGRAFEGSYEECFEEFYDLVHNFGHDIDRIKIVKA